MKEGSSPFSFYELAFGSSEHLGNASEYERERMDLETYIDGEIALESVRVSDDSGIDCHLHIIIYIGTMDDFTPHWVVLVCYVMNGCGMVFLQKEMTAVTIHTG